MLLTWMLLYSTKNLSVLSICLWSFLHSSCLLGRNPVRTGNYRTVLYKTQGSEVFFHNLRSMGLRSLQKLVIFVALLISFSGFLVVCKTHFVPLARPKSTHQTNQNIQSEAQTTNEGSRLLVNTFVLLHLEY